MFADRLSGFQNRHRRAARIILRMRRVFNEATGIDFTRYKRPDSNLCVYRELYDTETLAKKPFYNVGAGGFYHPFWTNIDHKSHWYSGKRHTGFVEYDLMACGPLPIAPESAKIIYSSHTIEHVSNSAVANLFAEAWRCLEPGGVLRVCMPDAAAHIAAYRRGDRHWFIWDEMYSRPGTYEIYYHEPANTRPLEERCLHRIASQLVPNDRTPARKKFTASELKWMLSSERLDHLLDNLCSHCEYLPNYPGNHINWWTHDKAIDFLRRAGFATVYRSGYGQSQAVVLRDTDFFDNTYPSESCYVEAVK